MELSSLFHGAPPRRRVWRKWNVLRALIGAPHPISKLVKSAPSTAGKSRIPREICPN
jgi:hypothetical protein